MSSSRRTVLYIRAELQGHVDQGYHVGRAEEKTAVPLLLRVRATPNGLRDGLNTSRDQIGHLAP